jgi:erythromycin esterase-like protein
VSTTARTAITWGERAQIRSLARPLEGAADLEPLVRACGDARFVCLGEASHGTHEFYSWRAALSCRLIVEHGFRWIGVEGDWPDCWRINRWVQGRENQRLTAVQLLAGFERWPTWMWANREVAEFLTWLHDWNLRRPEPDRVGFYGLDVYSLWDSLRLAISWVEAHAPDALPSAMRAWQCFLPYGEDPQRYAWSTRLVPESCEEDVVALLLQVRSRTQGSLGDDVAFDAAQNAEVAAGAEHYYRLMVRGDRASWNLRDHHMADTIDRIAAHTGPGSKGLVWEHNTHVGDARATDMARAGMVNVGQLVRERHSAEGVALVGFAAHRGTVLAAEGWGKPEHVFYVPSARAGSHEDLLHASLGRPAVLLFGADRSGPWLTARRGHRAIGVVYDPRRESGNYVPTVMSGRYDALIWLEHAEAIHPLHHEQAPRELELETEPSGY